MVTVLRHFASFAENLLDKMLLWSGLFRTDRVKLQGKELIAAQIAAKSGGLLICCHLGNLELCRVLSKQMPGLKLTVLTHTKHAARFNRLLAQLDPDSQLNLMEVTELSPVTAMLLSEKIAQGEFVAIAGDRIPVSRNPRIALARFLGATAPFPSWALYSSQPVAMSDLSDVFNAHRAHVGNSLSNCSASRFVYRARGAMKRSPDWWPNMPAGSSISACGRHCNGLIFTIFGIYLRWIHLMHPVDLKKTSTSARTIRFDDGRLKIEDIVDIAEGSASVALSDASEFRSAHCARGGLSGSSAARRGHDLWRHHRLRRFVHRDGPAGVGRRVAAPSLHLSRLRAGASISVRYRRAP